MENDNIKLIAQFQNFARYSEASLTLLENDLILKENGWKVYYAVDFSEIHSFLHPFSYIGDETVFGVKRIPNEDDEETLIREQTVLTFIFEHLSNLVLLPPYAVELSNHIELIRCKAIKTVFSYRDIIENKIHNKIHTYFNTHKSLKRLLTKSDISEMSEKDRTELIEFAKSEFRHLYLFLMSPNRAKKVTDTVKELMSNNNITNLFDWKPEIDLDFDEIKKDSTKWYSNLVRSFDQNPFSKYIDSLTCAYIAKINKIINREKEILFLISRDKILNRTLHYNISLKLLEKEKYVPLVRDLDYFLTFIRHNGFNIIEARNKIKRSKKIINNFLNLHKGSINRQLGQYSNIKPLWPSVSNALDELTDIISNRENINLAMVEYGIDAERIVTSARKRVSIDELNLVNVFNQILKHNRLVQRRLKDEDKKLLIKLGNSIENIQSLLSLPSKKNINNLINLTRGEKSISKMKLLLEPLNCEMPAEICFTQEPVIELARPFIEAHSHEEHIENQMRESILEIAASDSTNSEIHLLRAYIYGLLKRWKYAILEIDKGLQKTRSEDQKEFLLLKSIFCRALFDPFRGITACLKALKLDSDDPRTNREFSVLIWQTITKRSLKEKDKSELNKKIELFAQDFPSYELSIQYAEKSLSDNNNKYIQSQILNSLTYYYTALYNMKKNILYLNKAKDVFDKLEKTLPDDRWISRFHDTKGYFLFNLAASMGFPKHLVEEALASFNRALRDKYLSQEERNIILGHKNDAEMKLVTPIFPSEFHH